MENKTKQKHANTHKQHKLEEAVQLTVGNEGYMLFTLDKVVAGFMRQLKSVVEDSSSLKMLQLFKFQVRPNEDRVQWLKCGRSECALFSLEEDGGEVVWLPWKVEMLSCAAVQLLARSSC